MTRKSVLLIISGSIAAYKSLDLIRRLKERDIDVRCILTRGGAQFITPLSVASLSEHPVYDELFSLKDEVEMGHIRLSREADLIVIAPASADILAKMAHGQADDLATATLLASNKPILAAPAMNTQMWQNKATQRNIAQLKADGVTFIEPASGLLACGETGSGRMAEVGEIVEAILNSPSLTLPSMGRELSGITALVTSGPTHEPIDPVRYIGNRSSGKQGHAIAKALAARGAAVTLITGPTALPDPAGITVKHILTAEDMLKACEAALPADIAVCAAAIGDWCPSQSSAHKLKKTSSGDVPELHLIENPDILAHIARHPAHRPQLVIGFAAETDHVLKNATEKHKRKGCDWIVANDVSADQGFNVDDNQVTLISAKGTEPWPRMSKDAIAQTLVQHIIQQLGT